MPGLLSRAELGNDCLPSALPGRVIAPEGALLTIVLPHHSSLERCRLRSCCVELLQLVMSLLPLEEGCCIRRVGLVLGLRSSAVRLEGCECLPARLGRCEVPVEGEEAYAALKMNPSLAPAELLCEGVGLQVLWDHGSHVYAEGLVIEDLKQ